MSAEGWVSRRQRHIRLDSGSVALSREAVAGLTGQVMYFGDHLAFSPPPRDGWARAFETAQIV